MEADEILSALVDVAHVMSPLTHHGACPWCKTVVTVDVDPADHPDDCWWKKANAWYDERNPE